MRVLITGVNGFIGKHLACGLKSKGYGVAGLDIGECKVRGIDYFSGDVRDADLMDVAIDKVGAIVHLAALTAHKDIIDNKFETLSLNLQGTENVLRAFNSSETAEKFIYSSSGKVYGLAEPLPFCEDSPVFPINILGKSKFITERLIDFYANSDKSYNILRIFNVYGPNQNDNFLMPTIFNQLKCSDEVNLGDTKARRDYIYVDDVVNAFILSLDNNSGGLFNFNVCSGKSVNAEEIVSCIGDVAGRKIKVNSNHKGHRADEVSVEYGSYGKIRDYLGWFPEYSLREGLEKVIARLGL